MTARKTVLLLFFALSACVSTKPPTSDLVLADAALKAAERAQAERRSPDLYNRAQNAFWKAKTLYVGREFEEASKLALEARRLAERAEIDSEVKNAQISSNFGE